MKHIKTASLTMIALLPYTGNALFLQYINPKSSSHCLSASFLDAFTQEISIPNFIETGTFMGFTTEVALNFFSTVNTFELSPEHYYLACEKFAAFEHVNPHWGDSGRILPTVLSKLEGSSFFWLDAHYSGAGTAFIGCGTPIIEELKAIQNQDNPIIMIDDIRLFDLIPQRQSIDAGQGFPDMAEIYAELIAINPNFSFALLGDTLMAYDPNNNNITVSPVAQACTLSRLSSCLQLADEEVERIEAVIFHAQWAEKDTLRVLHNVYCHPQSNTPSPYYHVWYGLTLLADSQYDSAAQQFERAINLDFNPPRMQHYLKYAREHYVPDTI